MREGAARCFWHTLIKGGDVPAARAQIKVASTVKDLNDLRLMLAAASMLSKNKEVDVATRDQIDALSSPRPHRSP